MEKSDECLFLENVMIREKGLYVLMGSKPMSTFPYENGYPETEEQIRSNYLADLNEEHSNISDLDSQKYKDFAASCQKAYHLHSQKLWRVWKGKMSIYVGPSYRFVIRRLPFGNRPREGLFLSVPNVLYILNQYCDAFSKAYGNQFNPQKALDEIENDESAFWESVFQSDYLKGLLFGYGSRNSFIFDWQSKARIDLLPLLHNNQSVGPLLKRDIKVTDLALPSVMVYSLGEEVLKKYSHERKSIIQEFKGKDFELTVKQWLKR